jgi:hypothetical protein
MDDCVPHNRAQSSPPRKRKVEQIDDEGDLSYLTPDGVMRQKAEVEAAWTLVSMSDGVSGDMRRQTLAKRLPTTPVQLPSIDVNLRELYYPVPPLTPITPLQKHFIAEPASPALFPGAYLSPESPYRGTERSFSVDSQISSTRFF